MHGLDSGAFRPVRLPGPRGFSLLNQLILDVVGGRQDFQQLKKEKEEICAMGKVERRKKGGWISQRKRKGLEVSLRVSE